MSIQGNLRNKLDKYDLSGTLRTKITRGAHIAASGGAILVAHRMPSMTIHCSWDDGHTWDQGTMIDAAIWVMGGMVEVEPDVVLYIYFDSHESLMRAQFIRVTREGLIPVKR